MSGAPQRHRRDGGSVAQQRLRTQRLAGPGFAAPADVVRWFGAVQAQDYAGALWAIGMRTAGATEADVEQAVVDRAIVRTWPLRGTLHFVAAEDVRWMMTHFAPRIAARDARRLVPFGLDDRVFAKINAVLVTALEGGRQLSRARLYALLERAGIATGKSRGLHILWRCAHDGLICFGAREAKQQTFALLDEWVPKGRTLDRDEAIAELACRYFSSHGPATLKDFTWWSGLSAADARRAVEIASPVFAPPTRNPEPRTPSRPHVVLLPPYDEYTVAYQDRSAALDPADAARTRNGIFSPTILLDGRIVGTWDRAETKNDVRVATKLFAKLTASGDEALAAAVARFRAFTRRASSAPRQGSRSTR